MSDSVLISEWGLICYGLCMWTYLKTTLLSEKIKTIARFFMIMSITGAGQFLLMFQGGWIGHLDCGNYCGGGVVAGDRAVIIFGIVWGLLPFLSWLITRRSK